jgi:hypothetical protein
MIGILNNVLLVSIIKSKTRSDFEKLNYNFKLFGFPIFRF